MRKKREPLSIDFASAIKPVPKPMVHCYVWPTWQMQSGAEVEFEMPFGTEVLKVDTTAGGNVCLFAKVDGASTDFVKRGFLMVTTHDVFHTSARYVGTTRVTNTHFHIFERI